MRKKIPIWLLATVLLMTASYADAQQPQKVPRIGYVSASGGASSPDPQFEAFATGLRDLGYIDGKNIQIELRYAEAKQDRIPDLVAELVRLNVDMLVASALPTIRAAKQATKTIPIVMATTVDPVENGLVDSLAHPGGNLTGVSRLTRDLSGKRLELLKEVLPKLSRAGVFWDAGAPGPAIAFKEYQVAAGTLKVPLWSVELRGPNPDFEGAFHSAVKARASAVIIIRGLVFNRYPRRIADIAIKSRMPSLCEGSEYVEAGGLMSYATNDADSFRRLAVYVDKILKGAKPADLPVEQPMKFDLVFNLNTAKQIGLTIPPNVLVRADRVIR